MDLSSMLNEPSDPRDDFKKETNVMYQFSTSVHYVLAKDSKSRSSINGSVTPMVRPAEDANRSLSNPANKRMRISQNNNDSTAAAPSPSSVPPTPPPSSALSSASTLPASKKCLKLTSALLSDPSVWRPKLSLDYVMREHPLSLKPVKKNTVNNFDQPVQLKLHEAVLRGGEPTLLLEPTYEILGAYPRGFFVMMAKRNILHNFVFNYPDHPWFEDLFGLRKSAYFHLRNEDGELWEIHLKPSRDKQWLFGYLIKHSDMIRIVKDSMDELFHFRKLPLVLDLDDTLVRLVGEGNDRYVPESDLPKCGNRVHPLRDGKKVVVTERVHEFLEWAQQFYDISVCSLGDQNYVESVVDVLDPQRTCIRGILYSARSEHDYIKKSPDPGRPPKDLLALYSFCGLKDKSIGSAFSLPLILDDETRMWPLEQHDNIIEVKNQANTPVWSVSLFPAVQDCLQYVHSEFFRQYDLWCAKQQEAEANGTIFTRQPPTAVTIYKTYLRHILRDMIAKGPSL